MAGASARPEVPLSSLSSLESEGVDLPRENGGTEDVAFDYQLCDRGWTQVRVSVGRDRTELAASHVGQPLDRLITTVLAIAAGEVRVEVFWRPQDDGRQRWSHIL